MTSSEKFCLKWNDFQENIATSFHGLRESLDFTDVTLVCEDDTQIEAHRVILSVCSPFFSSVLKKNKHSHPIVYMRGLKSKELVSIVDFIYHGETNIYQEDLDNFLALAEELQLKGLAGSTDVQPKEEKEEYTPLPKTMKKIIIKKESSLNPYEISASIKEKIDDFTEISYEDPAIIPVETSRTIVNVDTNNEDLQTKIATMMQNITDVEGSRWICTVCGKVGKNKRDIGRHVECHIEGVSHPCNLCGKVSRSSNALHFHVSKYHRQ